MLHMEITDQKKYFILKHFTQAQQICYLLEIVYNICTTSTVRIYEIAAKESPQRLRYGHHLLFSPQ